MRSSESVRKKLGQFPHVPLSLLPTPLYRMDGMSAMHDGFDLYVKRDDQTGLAFGGNKARKLDYMMADVVSQGADCVVTWGGLQSNWCRQVAAAAAKLGMRTSLALFKGPTSIEGYDGNLLLDSLFDADIRVFEAADIGNMLEFASVRHVIEPIASELRSEGMTPYIAPIGGSLAEGSMQGPWGALGYVGAAVEIADQSIELKVQFDSVVLATGSAGTQAGLLAGARLLLPDTRVVGISVYGSSATVSGYVRAIGDRVLQEMGAADKLQDRDIIVIDDYIGEGYGVFNSQVGDAIRTLARSEGLLLDPVYTGKAMAGMVDLMDKGYFREGENILFLHTGGTPALFPYREQITDGLLPPVVR